jgi:ribosomal protein S18 acetylase RimI-like enzyme
VAESEPSVSDNPHAVARVIGRDDSVLVAEVDGELAGTLIVGWDGWRGNLYRLAVHPLHRRRGIALELVRAAEARLRRDGAVRVNAWVLSSADIAMSFWSAAGYHPYEGMARMIRDLGPE